MRSHFTKIAIFALCATVLLPIAGCGTWSDFDKDVKKNRENMENNDKNGADPDYNTVRGGGGTSDGSQ